MIMMMITGDKTIKNKVIVPNHQITKNLCHKSPNHKVNFFRITGEKTTKNKMLINIIFIIIKIKMITNVKS